jgi:hypothetical protein
MLQCGGELPGDGRPGEQRAIRSHLYPPSRQGQHPSAREPPQLVHVVQFFRLLSLVRPANLDVVLA